MPTGPSRALTVLAAVLTACVIGITFKLYTAKPPPEPDWSAIFASHGDAPKLGAGANYNTVVGLPVHDAGPVEAGTMTRWGADPVTGAPWVAMASAITTTATGVDGGPVNVQGISGAQPVATTGGSRQVACGCTTYADAGAGIACALADAGSATSCHVCAFSGNTSSTFVSQSANVATSGINMGEEILSANGVGTCAWSIAPGIFYAVSDAGSQQVTCQCAVQ